MFTDQQKTEIRAVKLVIRDKMDQLRRERYITSCQFDVTRQMFLAGGAIASLLQAQEPKDWDLYFNTSEDMTSLVIHLNAYNSDIADIDEKYRETYGLDGKMITNKAITMKNGCSFITMQYGSPESIKATFDYLHATPHYNLKEDKLYISPAQYDACVNKKLIVHNRNEVKEYRRSKFIERGYKEC